MPFRHDAGVFRPSGVSRRNFDGLKTPNPSSFGHWVCLGKKVVGKNPNGVSAKCAIGSRVLGGRTRYWGLRGRIMGEGFAFGGEGIGVAVRFAVDVVDSPSCGCVGKHLTDTIEVWTKSGDREVVVARDAVDNKLRISVDVKILEITFAGLE